VPECRRALRRLAHPAERQSRAAIPVVRVQATEHELTLSTTDGEVFALSRLQCEGTATGSAVCNYQVLRRLIEATDAEVLNLETIESGRALLLGVGHAEATLPTFSAETWNEGAPVEGPATSLDVATLAHMRRIQVSAATDMSRPALCGVHFGAAAIVASDGHRISVLRHTHAGPPLTIPRETLSAVLSSLSTGAVMRSDGTRAHISSEEMDWTTPLIDVPFPNYEHILPRYELEPSRMRTEELLGVLNRMEAVVGAGGSVTINPVSPEEIELRAGGAELGAIRESVTVDGQLARTATFRVSYLIDALNSMDTSRPSARIGTDAGPLELRGDRVRHILMPQSVR